MTRGACSRMLDSPGAQVAVFRLDCDNSPGSSMFDEQALPTERRQQQALDLGIGFIVNCLCVSTRRWFPVERHIQKRLGVVAPVTASKQSSDMHLLGQGKSTPPTEDGAHLEIPVTFDRCTSHCPSSIVSWVLVTWRHHHRACYRRRPRSRCPCSMENEWCIALQQPVSCKRGERVQHELDLGE